MTRNRRRRDFSTDRRMKYAIMSDAHSNPVALETALKDAKRRKCEKLLFLGDVTGYGYDVGTTLKLVKKSFDVVLMGNHDSVCSGLEDGRFVRMNPNYDIDRAQGQTLSKPDLAWLESLKHVYENEDLVAAHGDFVRPADWGYVFDEREAAASFAACPRELMFCGHTHHACVWQFDGRKVVGLLEDRFRRPAVKNEAVSFKLRKGRRYIVNVGSVGYPRNDYCCSYAIYDSEARRVTVRRLPFDFEGYVEAMRAAGVVLPMWLERLLRLAEELGPER